jgi:hypothetical protein
MNTLVTILLPLILGLSCSAVLHSVAQAQVRLPDQVRQAKIRTAASHTKAIRAPQAGGETLSYFQPNNDQQTWLTLPMWVSSADGEDLQIKEYYERFTSYLNQPVLDSLALYLAVAGPTTGTIKIELIQSTKSSGYYYPSESGAPIATYYINASTLKAEEATRIKIDCKQLKLTRKDFVLSIENESVMEEVYVAFDSLVDYRDRDDEIDRSYIRYVDSYDEEYYASLGGLFMTPDEEYYFPNMIATAYLHEGDLSPRPEEWKNSITGGHDDMLSTMIPTHDGGHLLVGSSASTGGQLGTSHGVYDCLVAKYDKTGVKQWIKLYGGSDDDHGYDAVQLKDGTFVVAAFTRSWDSPAGEYPYEFSSWIMWLDSNGKSIRDRAYGPASSGSASFSIAINSSNNSEHLIVSGWAASALWTARLTATGDTVWNHLTNADNSYISDKSSMLSVLPTGDHVVANGSGNWGQKVEPRMSFFNSNGELLRNVMLSDSASGVVAAIDGRYVTTVLDTLMAFDKSGQEVERHYVAGLQHATSIDPIPNGYAIGGRATRIGESKSKPVYFIVDRDGKTLGMAQEGGVDAEVKGVKADGDHLLVAYDELRSSVDIFVERLKLPASTLHITTPEDIETCRGETPWLTSLISSAWYPVTTDWYDSTSGELIESVTLRNSEQGKEARLIQKAEHSRTAQLRVSDATGGTAATSARITLGIEEAPVVLQSGNTLSSSITAASYQWLDGNGTAIALATAREYIPEQDGMYAVQVSNGNCTESSAPFTYTKAGVREAALANTIAYDAREERLNVRGLGGAIEIFNALGQPVMSAQAEVEELRLGHLPHGAYFVKASGGEVYSFVR